MDLSKAYKGCQTVAKCVKYYQKRWGGVLVKLTSEDISELLAASSNVQTAGTQIDNAAHGRPDLEELARECSRLASVIEIVAVTLKDEE